MKHLRIGVLASGGGSNLQSIIDHSLDGSLNGEVVAVISNNSGAGALERARRHGIDTLHISGATEGSPEAVDSRIAEEFSMRAVDVVALAGYMKKIGPALLGRFTGRIVNIHPALLPRFGGPGMYGIQTHRAVIDAGVHESGPTVHLVDDKYDHGAILDRRTVPVLPDDTPETLQKRVLEQEHELYPIVLQELANKWPSA